MEPNSLVPSWRWYGPVDPVTLSDVRQAGAEGVVSALHNQPHGAVWPLNEVMERKAAIEKAGLRWVVVESVPVHERIKTRSGNYRELLENYRQTLRHLGKAGIRTVCYNFMPVLDWTRTRLDFELEDGSRALGFDMNELALFDLHILKRPGAEADYPEEVCQKAMQLFKTAALSGLDTLTANILMGVPGEASTTIGDLQRSIDTYKGLGHEGLRENLRLFLLDILPVCEEQGIIMTIHPDDPPFDILGLPRVVSNLQDLEQIISMSPSRQNGICFCSGSLGAGRQNDLSVILKAVGERVHFVHLRNVIKSPGGNFRESAHLSGDVDMYGLMEILLGLLQKRNEPVPFRPDHGLQMLDDLHKQGFPGYSAIGRLKGLAELRGLALGISRSKYPSR